MPAPNAPGVESLVAPSPDTGWPKVAMVAGETSGDLLAGLLLKGLRQRWPGLAASGIGGSAMAAQGFEAQWPSDKLAVRGYAEVLRHYREISGIRSALAQRLMADPPDVFIGVDAPDFNLGLEAKLRAQGIKTVQFVCPSVWAWRAKRLETLQRSADHVLCIFPFEPALLAQHGVAATYVGHPLADVIPRQPDRVAARQQLGLAETDTVVAILPGSRASEIKYLADTFFQAARLINTAGAAIKFIVPAIPTLRLAIDAAVRRAGVESLVQVLAGQSHTALAACDVTLIASGTATLEAALFKRPMVIAYKMHWLSWRIMRAKQLQPWVGLPNILCREFVVPEFLQDQATPANLAKAVLDWLDNPAKIRGLQQRFDELHQQLQRDTATLATHAIEEVLNSAPKRGIPAR